MIRTVCKLLTSLYNCTTAGEVTIVNDLKEFESAMDTNKDKLIVAYHTAAWCGPCKMIWPIVCLPPISHLAPCCRHRPTLCNLIHTPAAYFGRHTFVWRLFSKKCYFHFPPPLHSASLSRTCTRMHAHTQVQDLAKDKTGVAFLKIDVDEAQEVCYARTHASTHTRTHACARTHARMIHRRTHACTHVRTHTCTQTHT